jgi:hypothetical protein
VIDANQAGNTTYAAAPQVQRTFTINPAVRFVHFLNTTSEKEAVAICAC